ncbi:hypothetical protein PVAP13_7KG205055 [Panicum virgatum]|uniref:Uncharacterized protein n=1 Tax=Panicum virgatum TaxID=38727 RepID=A0A8T0QD49_PANVG|nr:hypothetical protein PVAP13_7KG205055 [Panicum virgatum]KAG2572841.1 hypothetical protein PVAP13_7KG205055 [Panicum virgatum]
MKRTNLQIRQILAATHSCNKIVRLFLTISVRYKLNQLPKYSRFSMNPSRIGVLYCRKSLGCHQMFACRQNILHELDSSGCVDGGGL